jgi:drug/metabolite transporter (DMT)-like permease
MILGTPRRWWIALGVFFLIGVAVIATGSGGTWGTVVGVLLLLGAMIAFAAAPMRYGQNSTKSPPSPTTLPPVLVPPPVAGPRPSIEARDSAEV